MKLVERKREMEFLLRHRDRQIIKVVTGVRRCGKSTLLALFRRKLLKEGVPEKRIIAINFEDLAFEELEDYHVLYKYVTERMQPGGMNYIFLDEIQHVPHFEKVVDSLFIKENTDVYITGSNAFFLSGELATLLSGRYVEISMLPLSFKEFCEGLETARPLSLPAKYELYTKTSAFPYTLTMTDHREAVLDYLSGIYNTILVKDTLSRLGRGEAAILGNIMKYLAANIGSLISPKKIADSLTSLGRKTDYKTVERYLTALKESLLIYQADRYDVKGKNLLKINAKYYMVDPAFRQILINDKGQDTGHILENIVYLELLRRGFHVSVGQLPKGEIDFVAEKNGSLAYYQVSESTLSPKVLDRELTPLRQPSDQYPRYLLTLDEISANADYDGIRKMNVLQWMMEEKEK